MSKKISFTICVCNESRDLYSLVSFLKKVRDPNDDIDILVDSAHVTPQVQSVLEYFKDSINVYSRDFDGNFSEHRNYQISKCTGDYIFVLDPDEMPQEALVRGVRKFFTDSKADILAVPRMNMCPGHTEEWALNRFKLNELGWINWPDYQTRIFKNNIGLKFDNAIHEMITGSKNISGLPAEPRFSLWHIKSVDKQDNRWVKQESGEYIMTRPDSKNLYDSIS